MKPRKPIKKRRGVRRGPWRSPAYRRWIAEHSSCLRWYARPGDRLEPGKAYSQACHTQNNGTSSKGNDSSCVPLTGDEHREYDANRKAFEKKYDVDMKAIAAQYYAQWISEGNIP